MAKHMNARVDGVKKGIHSVFWTAKVIWKGDVERSISVLALPHFQLPPCKVGLFLNIGVEMHVLIKVKLCNVRP